MQQPLVSLAEIKRHLHKPQNVHGSAYQVSEWSLTSNVITVKFKAAHAFEQGDKISLQLNNSTVDGARTVATVPQANHVTINLTASNISAVTPGQSDIVNCYDYTLDDELTDLILAGSDWIRRRTGESWSAEDFDQKFTAYAYDSYSEQGSDLNKWLNLGFSFTEITAIYYGTSETSEDLTEGDSASIEWSSENLKSSGMLFNSAGWPMGEMYIRVVGTRGESQPEVNRFIKNIVKQFVQIEMAKSGKIDKLLTNAGSSGENNQSYRTLDELETYMMKAIQPYMRIAI